MGTALKFPPGHELDGSYPIVHGDPAVAFIGGHESVGYESAIGF